MAAKATNIKQGNFYLSKWFLDYTGTNGEAMIFYSAKLTWRGWNASYTSWLSYSPDSGVSVKSRFSNIRIPELNTEVISWSDSKFGVSGTWNAVSPMVRCRLFDSEEGLLDWECCQPASIVNLKINDRVLHGDGYAEHLTLTIPPWKIPMDELRWGRFISNNNILVWIELRKKGKKQWLWLNGEKISDCFIEDNRIAIPIKNLVLTLDRGVILESEKKIQSVVGKIIRYLPGFNKIMPLGFLMADECKWLSKGKLLSNGNILSEGMAIHELVDFNPL